MAQAEATVLISGDSTGIERELRKTRVGLNKFGRSIGGVSASLLQLFSAQGIASFGRQLFDLFRTQEQAEARVESQVRATGMAAGFTAEQLKEMAAQMQQTTTFGDELVLSAIAIGQSFTNIHGEQFEDMIRLAGDLATVMGTGLEGATTQLAKALNDPIRGITALSRSGVQFTEQQRDMIRALVESGKTLEAQQVILDELENQFGGAAAAAADTFSGGVEQMSNRVSDLGESLFGALLPALSGTGGFLDKVVTAAERMIPVIGELAEAFNVWAANLFEQMMPTLQELGTFIVDAFSIAQVIILNFGDVIDLMLLKWGQFMLGLQEDGKHVLGEILPTLWQFVVDTFKAAMLNLAELGQTVFGNMLENVKSFFGNLKSILQGDGAQFEFTALTDGFELTLAKLPEIAERQLTAQEKALAGLISTSEDAFASDFASTMQRNNEFVKNLFRDRVEEQVDIQAEGQRQQTETQEREQSKRTGNMEDLVALNERIAEAANETQQTGGGIAGAPGAGGQMTIAGMGRQEQLLEQLVQNTEATAENTEAGTVGRFA